MNTYFKFLNTAFLDEKIATEKFPFSKYLFWDSPIEMIDVNIHKTYIVERVLNKGFLSDFYLLLKTYTRSEIIAAIKKSKTLDAKTTFFCSKYFNVPINELHASSYYS
jgi:hypothetical protein